MKSEMVYKKIVSPVGALKLVSKDGALVAILWQQQPDKYSEAIEDNKHQTLAIVEQQLNEYFGQKRKVFDVPLCFAGTDFQKKVWQALLDISHGETCNYADIAEQIGHPRAHRAVGSAIGRNPLMIIVPCHRVVPSSGHIGSYAGGTKAKTALLTLENTFKAK